MNRSIKYLPNLLTIIRILLTPICIYFLIQHHALSNEGFSSEALLSFLIFIAASLTDAFDGYYARKYNLISRLGTFLDPLADKILVISIFTCFFYMYSNIVDVYVIIMIVFRDVFVTLIRLFMEYKGHTMLTSNLSKIKTAIQIIAINIMFISIIFNQNLAYSDYLYALMILTGVITFYTGIDYFLKNYNKIKSLVTLNAE